MPIARFKKITRQMVPFQDAAADARRRAFGVAGAVVAVLVLGALASPWMTPASAEANATGGGESLFVDVDHLILSQRDGSLAVSEMVSVINNGTKAADLRIALPKGYKDLTMRQGLDGAQVKMEGGELLAPGVVAPGKPSTFAISYLVPWDKLNGGLAKKILYATGNLYILAEEPDVSAKAAGLSDAGVQSMGERRFRQLAAANLTAGTTLQVQVAREAAGTTTASVDKDVAAVSGGAGGSTGTTASSADAGTTRVLNKSYHGGEGNRRLWARYTGIEGHGGLAGILLFLLVLAGLGAGVYRAVKVRKRRGSAAPSATKEESLPERGTGNAPDSIDSERRTLIEKLAALDLAFRDGSVPEEEYRSQRAALKARLVELTLRLRENEG